MADTSAVGTFLVKITAVDKATAILNKVNSQIEKATRPVREYGAALKKLAAAAHLDKLGDGFRRVHAGAAKAFGILTSLITPLKLITGAATVGGMAALIAKFGDYGMQLSQAAARARTSAIGLETFKNAVDLAGGSAEAASEGLQTFQDLLTNSPNDNKILLMLQNLHIDDTQFRKANGELKTASELLPLVFDSLSRIQDQSQRAVAGRAIFGGAYDGIAPAVNGGSARLASLEDEAKKHSGLTPEAIDNAQKFDLSMRALKQSVKGAGDAVSNVLAPPLTHLMDYLSGWVDSHRPKLAKFFGDMEQWAEGVDWAGVGKTIQGLWTDVDGVAQSLGGWKTALEVFFGVMAGSFVLKIINPFLYFFSLLGSILGRLALLGGSPILTGLMKIGAGAAAVETGLWVAGGVAGTAAITGIGIGDSTPDGPHARFRVSRPGENVRPPAPANDDEKDRGPGWLDRQLQSLGIEGKSSSFKNNNPTNLMYLHGEPYTTGAHGRWATYNSPEEGIAGGLHQMLLDQDRGYNTIAKELYRRSPPEDNNDTEKMIAEISRQTGLDRNAKYDLRDPRFAQAFLGADIGAEHGEAQWATDAQLGKGVALELGRGAPVSIGGGTGATAGGGVNGSVGVTVTHVNAPTGTTISATSSGTGVGKPVVERAMAGS
jgi:hypothetical protein